MKAVTMYEAKDGKQFPTEELCTQHERLCDDLAAANEMLENGYSLRTVLSHAYRTLSWWDAGLSEEDLEMLASMNKDSGIAVRHWQCSDKPGYKFCRVGHGERIHLFGDAGCWSGPYGNWVSVGEFVRLTNASRGSAS